MKKDKKIAKGLLVFKLVLGSIFAILISIVPVFLIKKDWLYPFLGEEFSKASFSIEVPMMGWEWLIGLLYLIVVFICYRLFRQGKIRKPIIILSLSGGLVLFLYNIFVVPKIEAYSQGPAISFYQDMATEDVYVRNIGYKSYAQYFYLRQKPYENPAALDNSWLLKGDIDKDAYFILKIHKRDLMDEYDDIEFYEQRGGFVIYKRVKASY